MGNSQSSTSSAIPVPEAKANPPVVDEEATKKLISAMNAAHGALGSMQPPRH